MGKERAYSAKPSITSGDRCRASLPGLDLLLSMGAASHRPHARSLRPLGAVSPRTPHKPWGQSRANNTPHPRISLQPSSARQLGKYHVCIS
jgi:hypothetical protein